MQHIEQAAIEYGAEVGHEAGGALKAAFSGSQSGAGAEFQGFLRLERANYQETIVGGARTFLVTSAPPHVETLLSLEMLWERMRRRQTRVVVPPPAAEVAAEELFGSAALPLDEALRHARFPHDVEGPELARLWGAVAELLEQVQTAAAPSTLERTVLEVLDAGPATGVLEDAIGRGVESAYDARGEDLFGNLADLLAEMVYRGVIIWAGAEGQLEKPMRYRRQNPEKTLCVCGKARADYERRNGGLASAPAVLCDACHRRGPKHRHHLYVRLIQPGRRLGR